MKQATYWYAQLVDGTKIQGGQQHLYPNQPNVSIVPSQAIRIFCIAHNTYTDQYYQPWDQWYIARIETKVTYPLLYQLSDGSVLKVNQDPKTKLLILTQDYGNGTI
jgi:hypothetical protein